MRWWTIEESVDDLEVSVVSIEVDGRVSGSVRRLVVRQLLRRLRGRRDGIDATTSAAGDDAALTWSVVASLSTTRTSRWTTTASGNFWSLLFLSRVKVFNITHRISRISSS